MIAAALLICFKMRYVQKSLIAAHGDSFSICLPFLLRALFVILRDMFFFSRHGRRCLLLPRFFQIMISLLRATMPLLLLRQPLALLLLSALYALLAAVRQYILQQQCCF